MINWHQSHGDNMTIGGRCADAVAQFMGSWNFIILQTMIVIVWMMFNIVGWFYHFDPYPYILLNLVFSTQAAYAAPIIMQSQNRQAERDRHHAEADYMINLQAKLEIERLHTELGRIEINKLDKIITLLEKNPR